MAQRKKRDGISRQSWNGPKRKRSSPHKHNEHCSCPDKVMPKKEEEMLP